MALQIEKAGINLCAIYRPLNNLFLNKTMKKLEKILYAKIKLKKEDRAQDRLLKI